MGNILASCWQILGIIIAVIGIIIGVMMIVVLFIGLFSWLVERKAKGKGNDRQDN